MDLDFLAKTIAIPVASALIGSFVTSARNESLVTAKLDQIATIAQELRVGQKEQAAMIADLREKNGVIEYRLNAVEKAKNAKER